MRAWTEEPEERRGGRGGQPRPDPAELAELADAGIDLDPRGHAPGGAPGDAAGEHRHGDLVHAHDHPHPHPRSGPGERPAIGIVGAGAVGTALAVAITRAGWPLVAVASRDAGRRERMRGLVPAIRLFAEANALLDEAELVILAVPDDAIPAVAGGLRLYGGQALVHTSGLLGADALAPAMAAGSQAGAFHPLVSITADVERAVADLRGATIAVEGDEGLVGLLADLAEAIGGVPARLLPGTKAAYHAAAVLAAGGLVALLDAIAELARGAGLDEQAALAIYGRLIEQTLANARALGIRAALTGPVVRADLGTLEAHLAAVARLAPGALELYLAAARRELRLAEQRGALAPAQVERVRTLLAKQA